MVMNLVIILTFISTCVCSVSISLADRVIDISRSNVVTSVEVSVKGTGTFWTCGEGPVSPAHPQSWPGTEEKVASRWRLDAPALVTLTHDSDGPVSRARSPSVAWCGDDEPACVSTCFPAPGILVTVPDAPRHGKSDNIHTELLLTLYYGPRRMTVTPDRIVDQRSPAALSLSLPLPLPLSIPCARQTTTVRLPRGVTLSHTLPPGVNVTAKASSLVFTPQRATVPVDQRVATEDDRAVVHFESNLPHLQLRGSTTSFDFPTSLSSIVTVLESVPVEHLGPRLSSGFSRLGQQRSPSASLSAVTKLTHRMHKEPGSEFGGVDEPPRVHVFDEVGPLEGAVWGPAQSLAVTPRTILFGGWRTHYFLSYTLKLTQLSPGQAERDRPVQRNVGGADAALPYPPQTGLGLVPPLWPDDEETLCVPILPTLESPHGATGNTVSVTLPPFSTITAVSLPPNDASILLPPASLTLSTVDSAFGLGLRPHITFSLPLTVPTNMNQQRQQQRQDLSLCVSFTTHKAAEAASLLLSFVIIALSILFCTTVPRIAGWVAEWDA